MPLDSTVTYDQDPPRRVTLDDLDGGNLENDTPEPPEPGIDPDARAMNQRDKQVVALGTLSQAVRIEVHFSGSTPGVFGAWGLPTGMSSADFTPTDNGTGVTTITLTGDKPLPAKQWSPSATPVGDVGDVTMTCLEVANGWQVKTRVAGTLVDVPFTIHASGLG